MSRLVFDNSIGALRNESGTDPVYIQDNHGLTIRNEAVTQSVNLSATGATTLTLTGTLAITADLDMTQGQALNFIFETRTTDPGSPIAGQSYWKTDANALRVYTGTAWDTLSTPLRRIIDVTEAVPGQANTYYIDKGATTFGYNVEVDPEGVPLIRVLANGQEVMWDLEANFSATNGDYDIVRSLSTGAEGPAAVGSKNAIKFNGSPPTGKVWFFYHRKSLATLLLPAP